MFEDVEWFVSPWQLDFALQAWSFTRMRVTDGPLLAWASGWFSCKGPWKENSLGCTQIDVATLTFSCICCDFSWYFDESPLFTCFFLSAWRPAVYHFGRMGVVGFPFCPGRRKASCGEAITRTQPARWAEQWAEPWDVSTPLAEVCPTLPGSLPRVDLGSMGYWETKSWSFACPETGDAVEGCSKPRWVYSYCDRSRRNQSCREDPFRRIHGVIPILSHHGSTMFHACAAAWGWSVWTHLPVFRPAERHSECLIAHLGMSENGVYPQL